MACNHQWRKYGYGTGRYCVKCDKKQAYLMTGVWKTCDKDGHWTNPPEEERILDKDLIYSRR